MKKHWILSHISNQVLEEYFNDTKEYTAPRETYYSLDEVDCIKQGIIEDLLKLKVAFDNPPQKENSIETLFKECINYINIHGDKKPIFVCSRYKGNVQKHVQQARDICRKLIIDFKARPFAPHLFYPNFLNDNITEERLIALNQSYYHITQCDCMLVVIEDEISEGMKTEIEFAKEYGTEIFYCKYDEFMEFCFVSETNHDGNYENIFIEHFKR